VRGYLLLLFVFILLLFAGQVVPFVGIFIHIIAVFMGTGALSLLFKEKHHRKGGGCLG